MPNCHHPHSCHLTRLRRLPRPYSYCTWLSLYFILSRKNTVSLWPRGFSAVVRFDAASLGEFCEPVCLEKKTKSYCVALGLGHYADSFIQCAQRLSE